MARNDMTKWLSIALCAVLALGLGCSSKSQMVARDFCAGEMCPVCRFRNDLACVCVNVGNDTPEAQHQGRTYHFCSESCRREFLETPTLYVSETMQDSPVSLADSALAPAHIR